MIRTTNSNERINRQNRKTNIECVSMKYGMIGTTKNYSNERIDRQNRKTNIECVSMKYVMIRTTKNYSKSFKNYKKSTKKRTTACILSTTIKLL